MNKFLLALAIAAYLGNVLGNSIISTEVNTPNHAALEMLVAIEAN